MVEALRARGRSVAVVDTVAGAIPRQDEDDVLVRTVSRKPPTLSQLVEFKARERDVTLLDIPALLEAEVIFLVLHGRQGEGGELQAALENGGLTYTGSGVRGSQLAMDKDRSKRMFRDAGVPTPEWLMWPADAEEIAAVGYPLVVKPSKAGSTVGLSVVQGPDALEAAVRLALTVDGEVVLERFAPGRELTVGVLGDAALTVGEIIPQHQIFDYECKYTPGMTEEIFPAVISQSLTDRVRTLALDAHRTLELRDFSRVDFRLDADGIPLCLEANTLPGFTGTSLLPQSAAACGIDFPELCHQIIGLALRRAVTGNKVKS